ncbi:TetR/AcrR family transcriptional regulator [Gordonia sp. X0973]|uniref:TetR/AcrR family transcriptional regulator n=1 Tax=Gordonia sp. X0973 TaxID=2742602 RepID=UPI000F5240CC|nr:TetR/AcrR family transcriptional regulator [Gordonia sp. X0973]QKT07043.1 TetR/AcrR family transcriptional regulator [Gordonia sp. X0973]
MDEKPRTRRKALTRRRIDTRERLLDAAMGVFVAKGFGRTRIDDVCQAAGYTKGAFYSNFTSLEELFFALYDRQSEVGATAVLAAVDPASAAAADSTPAVVAVVEEWAMTVPLDRDWLLINTDFVSYAARFPEVAADLADHRRRLRAEVIEALTAFVAASGIELPASLPTPADLARAVVTVYDGVIYQLLLDMSEAQVRQHLVAILTAVVS